MKVVYLNPSGQMGGAERSLLDFMSSLRGDQPNIRLELITGAEGPFVEQARGLGFPARALPYPRALARLGDAGVADRARMMSMLGRASLGAPSIALYVGRLRRTLAAAAPDLVHTNGFKMHVLGAWAAPRGVPVLWHIHDYLSTRPVMARMMKMNADRCAAVVANSLSVAEDVRAACGSGVRVFPIHNAIDLGRFSPEGPALDLDRLSCLAPPDAPVVRIGLVATMARWKGQEVFLRALQMISGEAPVRGYLIGGALYDTDGSQYRLEDLRRIVSQMGLADRIGFTGFVENVPAAMRALDVVVHASTRPEPFGLVIAEAMGCGRAVVVSEGGGASEIVTPGEDGLAHQAGSASALAQRIMELVRDPALRAAMGSRAMEAARRRFARDRLARELMPIYRMLHAEPA